MAAYTASTKEMLFSCPALMEASAASANLDRGTLCKFFVKAVAHRYFFSLFVTYNLHRKIKLTRTRYFKNMYTPQGKIKMKK